MRLEEVFWQVRSCLSVYRVVRLIGELGRVRTAAELFASTLSMCRRDVGSGVGADTCLHVASCLFASSGILELTF